MQEVIEHLGQQCLALTNMENGVKVEETKLHWDLHATHFNKLDKLDAELDKLDIEWPTSIKITQSSIWQTVASKSKILMGK